MLAVLPSLVGVETEAYRVLSDLCKVTWLISGGSGTVKSPSESQETWVRSLDREDPLEEGLAIHSSILAQRILWTGSLAGYSPWRWKVRHD